MLPLAVTLTASDNTHLVYPCAGMLELFEVATNGQISVGVFRQYDEDGKPKGGPVKVNRPAFTHGKGGTDIITVTELADHPDLCSVIARNLGFNGESLDGRSAAKEAVAALHKIGIVLVRRNP